MQSHHNDRWRHNHTLTLLTENHTWRKTGVSVIDCAFFEGLIPARSYFVTVSLCKVRRLSLLAASP